MTRCGWCGHNAVMVPVDHEAVLQQEGEDDFRGDLMAAWQLFQCPGCKAPSLAQGHLARATNRPGVAGYRFVASGWYPEAPLVKTYPDSVPAAIAAVAAEAHGSLSVKHFRAAVALARSVIEASAKDKGITKSGIASKIDELFAQGLIYEHVKDAAHEVRFAGNEVAHGDLVDNPVSEEETEAILELMDMVLDGVFIAPAKTAAQAARRMARKLGGV